MSRRPIYSPERVIAAGSRVTKTRELLNRLQLLTNGTSTAEGVLETGTSRYIGTDAATSTVTNAHLSASPQATAIAEEAATRDPRAIHFICACAEGRLREVEQSLKQGIDLNPRDKLGYTGLHYAALNGHTAVVRLLIAQSSCQCDATSATGETPVHLCARGGSDDGEEAVILRLLLKSGTTASVRDARGQTPLHLAVDAGRPELVAVLLKDSVDLALDAVDTSGATALHRAILMDRADLCGMLLRCYAKRKAAAAEGNSASNGNGAGSGSSGNSSDHFVLVPVPFGDARLTPLQLACMANSPGCVRMLLRYDSDGPQAALSACDAHGRRALHLASAEGHGEIAALLLDAGADCTALDNVGRTPLHWAACMGNPVCVDGLLAANPETLNLTDNREASPLLLAATTGDTPAVARLLAFGANTALADRNAQIPLHAAAASGSLHCFELLLEPERAMVFDARGRSLLHYAANVGDKRVLEITLARTEAKTILNAATDVAKETALHLACLSGDLSSVRVLLEYKADVSCVDARGWTCLHCACDIGVSRIVESLLDAGADISAEDSMGRSALHVAASAGSELCAKSLLERGASTSAIDSNGLLPLHSAASAGYSYICEALLHAGAHVNKAWLGIDEANAGTEQQVVASAADLQLSTPLDLAVAHNHKDCALLLAYWGGMTRAELETLSAVIIQAAWRAHNERRRSGEKSEGVKADSGLTPLRLSVRDAPGVVANVPWQYRVALLAKARRLKDQEKYPEHVDSLTPSTIMTPDCIGSREVVEVNHPLTSSLSSPDKVTLRVLATNGSTQEATIPTSNPEKILLRSPTKMQPNAFRQHKSSEYIDRRAPRKKKWNTDTRGAAKLLERKFEPLLDEAPQRKTKKKGPNATDSAKDAEANPTLTPESWLLASMQDRAKYLNTRLAESKREHGQKLTKMELRELMEEMARLRGDLASLHSNVT